jgi:mono/diheme cytochrome c family protein
MMPSFMERSCNLKKTLRIAAIGLAVLLVLAGCAFGTAVWLGERKLQRTVDVRVVPVPHAKAPAALKLGKYLFESRGCSECHGDDGRGIAFIDTAGGMYVKSPNITQGPGGVVSDYNEGDWVRAIRHGVNPKGHALLIMPGEDYNRMNDNDFAALVAYARSLLPVPGESAIVRLPAIVKALYGVGAIEDASEKIDHRRPPSAPVAVAATVEHGAYVANMCVGCHGPGLSGGKVRGGPPAWPSAANLTPGEGSAMTRYDSAGKFVSMMRTGKRPDGTEVSPGMPFMSLRNLNDTDLNAMYAYLKTVGPRKAGER